MFRKHDCVGRVGYPLWSVVPLVAVCVLGAYVGVHGSDEELVDYTRHIKPILSNGCYACHGPDESTREADLRLDVRDSAIESAIVPGDAANSYLIERIAAEDPDDLMPPSDSKKPPLTEQEIDLVRRWIDQGAEFDVHWAYVPPKRPAVPGIRNHDWPLDPIDFFIARAHEDQQLEPSPEAERRTLIRRLSFDLTGLPPKPEEVDAFLADRSPDAYDNLVDRLLASPHFGERMAVYWLDVVRYADTGGYHSDNHRDVYLYRDYVIESFNENKPFDRFVTEQIAGDLLPDATREQKIGSGFNRLLQTTEEGGAQPKEYQAKYDADRVRNTGAAFLGATTGCAQCHDHKFDPYTLKDFYSFAAFFADIKEKSVGRQDQTKMPTEEQTDKIVRLDGEIAAMRKVLNTSTPELEAAQGRWEKTAKRPVAADGADGSPKNVADALAVAPQQRTEKQKQELAAYYRSIAPELASVREKIAELEKAKQAVTSAAPTSLISMSVSPRTIRILPRGNWLDDSGEEVGPAVPEFLGKLDAGDRPPNRLDLAQWLVSRENTTVSRVFVNRLWKLFFGQGIVKPLDDFGAQGEPPSHPELLDWLAVEFIANGWNVKHMIKLMVTSQTYRQSSEASEELLKLDPTNRWLARQGRFRLDAEFVRDNALSVSGLLSPKIGGPSVKPYQPAGYWQHLNFPKRTYQHDRGESQYRRGLYTYWQRTFIHPSLLAFDASSREECTVERPRSNTPLQALVLLNDPTYVEAAGGFAARILENAGPSQTERLAFAFREALGREPDSEETNILADLYRKHRDEYSSDPSAAGDILSVGEVEKPDDVEPVELAAWTSVARVILNLHETVTRY